MRLRLIDTHCHPQFPQYDRDRDTVIRASLDAGIGMVCVGTDAHTSREAIALAERYEGLYASVGWHPNDDLSGPQGIESFIALAAHPKVVAIGEVGLDFYRTAKPADRQRQAERFIAFASLARERRLPLIVHCRDAHTDMLPLLSKDMPTVIHSFNAEIDTARKYLDYGCMIGLNAIVTYAKGYADMVRMIPPDRLLVETDAPYLAPAPHRGERNEPRYVVHVAAAIAAMRNVPVDEFSDQVTKNTMAFFCMK